MHKYRNMRVTAIIILLVCILSLTVAFAALSQSINISGAGKIKGSNWSIVFADLSNTSTGTAQDVNSSIQNGTLVNLSAVLKKPGDKVTYTFNVINNGTIDAAISDINISGINGSELEDLNIKFSYNNDENYGNAIPKVKDSLPSAKIRPLKVEIEFNPNATTVSSIERTLDFSVSLIYIQASINQEIDDNTETQFDLENTFSTDDIISTLSKFSHVYPSRAASAGYSIMEADTNDFIFSSPGIDYKFNGIYTEDMVGKNIMLKFEVATSGVTNIGAGYFVQLRKYKEGEIVDAYDKDYYGVLYDGSTFKIVKSQSSNLITMTSADISQNILGNYYSTIVKTFNNLIHAEIRDSEGNLMASLDYVSDDFNNQTQLTNCISYNNNVRYRNIQSKELTGFTNIIAFGDSNTYGESLPSNQRVNLSWPGQINNLSETTNISAMNKGITYNTSNDLVNRLTNDVYSNKIIGSRNIVIIYIGTNDFNQKYGNYQSALDSLKSNIEIMRSGMTANGFEVWLVTFPICNDPVGPGQGRNDGLRAYNDWLINDYYAIQNKVPIVIDFASVAVDPTNPNKLIQEYVASDGLHSSGIANAWIAAKIIENL